ncbi:Immunoglobulin E-set [Penicillium cosmopolitanum]|uniref:Immunoglobulin E-set n=1 Tax=Penicillium cosmopolitanum TaxID=1131564 RepID=A0A9W9VY40_9EURO|nr:Immunoglobulin E-set [Penicillium cosmopolitanum]KAJ5391573.1 Immunoglobulin E-set [Penicillium cosmopolitanum]
MDDEMESAFINSNMDFLDPTQLDMPSGSAGGDFDDLFARSTNSRPNGAVEPSKHYQDQHPLRQPPVMAADSPAESPDASSRSSSSESPRNHLRQASIASTNSAAHSENPLTSTGYSAEDWMRPELSCGQGGVSV